MRKEVRVPEKDANKAPKLFTYDSVFDDTVGQCEVYDQVVAPLVQEVIEGYNCTVFAYGQTGTGKTYTMEGHRSDLDCSWQDDPQAGIIPRALDQLFEVLAETPGDHSVGVSYMELYNENLYDLLSPNEELVKLNIYDDNTKKGNVKVGGISEVTVHKKAEIYEVLKKGSAKRQTAATKLNACSSRSHTIFAVTVRIKDVAQAMDGEEVYRIGKLNLVDLAGSENIGRSGAVEKRATEAGNINRSLLTLGRVITSLVEKNSHIPYRESKLTRLLQDSLGGKTKTSIIATISPNQLDLEDTLSTLEYAQRAKKITNKPECNQTMSKMTVLKEMTSEIERLRRDLEACRGGSNAYFISKDNLEAMEENIKDLEEKDKENCIRLRDLEEELERLKILFGETSATLHEKLQVLKETEANLARTEVNLKETKEVLTLVSEEKEEQEHLVKVHVKTEKKLTSQAEKLLSVANTSTDHTERLHSKVSRVKSVEETNFNLLQEFKANDDEMINQLLTVIEEGSVDFLKSLEKQLTDSLVSLLQSSLKTTQQMPVAVNRLTTAVSIVKQSLDEKVGSIEQTTLGLLSQSNGMGSVVDEIAFKQSIAISSISSQTSSALDGIRSEVVDSHSKFEVLQMNMAESIKNLTENRENGMKSLSNLFHSKMSQEDTDRETLLKQMQELQVLQRLFRKEKQEMISNMMETFEQMDQKLEKSIEELMQKLNESRESIRTTKDHVKKSIEGTFSSLSGNEKDILSVVNETDAHSSSFFQSIMDKIQGIENTNSSLCESSKKDLSDCNLVLKKKLDSNTAIIQDQLSNEIKNLREEIAQSLPKLNDSVKEELKNVEILVQETHVKTEFTQSSLEKILLPEKLSYKQLMKDLQEGILDRKESVVQLIETQLQKDMSTGETPQKVNFSYPTKLVQTSPHERILGRFRSNKILQKQSDLAALKELPVDEDLDDSVEEEEEPLDPNRLICTLDMKDGGDSSESRPSSADSQVENKSMNGSRVSGAKSKLPKLETSFGKLAPSVKQNLA